MLLYNLPIFTEGDANSFLAGVARAHRLMKKVRLASTTPAYAHADRSLCVFNRGATPT